MITVEAIRKLLWLVRQEKTSLAQAKTLRQCLRTLKIDSFDWLEIFRIYELDDYYEELMKGV